MEARCYHRMLDYLLELTGISKYKQIDYTSPNNITGGWNHRLHFILDGKDLGQLRPKLRKGGIKVLTNILTGVDTPRDTKFDRIYRDLYRDPEEFNYLITRAKDYKDCLGGGWSSMIPAYWVNDKLFAAMECSCF